MVATSVTTAVSASPLLNDSFGRRFHYLRLSVTDVCNFKCAYCLPQGFKKKQNAESHLSIQECENLVRAFTELGLRKIRLTGGEPTTRLDLLNLISALSQVAGVEKIALTTNGWSLKKNVHAYRTAGVRALNVSVDSLNPDRFREITGSDRLPEILDGIEESLSLGFDSVKINVVALKGWNDHEMEEFLLYVKSRPVSIRWIELMRTADQREFFEQRHVSGQQIEAQLHDRGWKEVSRALDSGPAREFAHPEYVGRIGLIAPYSKDFCSSCNRLRVSSTGDLRLCLFGDQRVSLRPWLQSADQKQELIQKVLAVMGEKPLSHRLHQGDPGSTRHLAEIGG